MGNQAESMKDGVINTPYIKPEIKGYRELSQSDIDLMNESKALAIRVGEFVDHLSQLNDTDKRWVNIAKTDLQKGFMSLTRSIAKPDTF